jgi:pentatricopeptide repeat protein
MKEMASEGVPPTQAAYTSLLAACYKVCNDGRIPHPIRAKAGKFGWQQWQEMRIVGIEPDVMAYGAIIRLCASRGQPERAINLLEMMELMTFLKTA